MFCNLRGRCGGISRSGCRTFRRGFSSGREISIPVPWGTIAGKEWGPPDGTPWLAVHGWVDNAGSFDKLLPKFAVDKRVVAIDYPGHGFSSHIAKGANYHDLESIGYFERVVKYLGWEKFSFLGHSLGGNFGCHYAAVFPEKIQCLVMLDVLGFAVNGDVRDPDQVVDLTRRAILSSLDLEKKLETKPERVYESHEASLERLMAAMVYANGTIPREPVEIILRRGLGRNEEGYSFTRDIRLMPFFDGLKIYGLPRNFLLDLASGLEMPHLIVKASSGPIFDTQENIDELLKMYKKNHNFELHTVEGGHHVHLTNPERVLPVLDKFIRDHEL